jgi:hypothetical protein
LRVCSQSENSRNRRRTSSSSGFKGVTWDAEAHKWAAAITPQISGNPKRLGRFTRLEDAVAAYDAAALRYFGAFAAPNSVVRS